MMDNVYFQISEVPFLTIVAKLRDLMRLLKRPIDEMQVLSAFIHDASATVF